MSVEAPFMHGKCYIFDGVLPSNLKLDVGGLKGFFLFFFHYSC